MATPLNKPTCLVARVHFFFELTHFKEMLDSNIKKQIMSFFRKINESGDYQVMRTNLDFEQEIVARFCHMENSDKST